MKKIAFLVPSLGMGGMERVLVNYANLFSRRGYDVSVFNMTSDDSAIVKHFDGAVHYYSHYVPIKHFLHASIRDIICGNVRFLPFSLWINFHSDRYLNEKYFQEFFDIEVAFFGITSIKIVNGCVNAMTERVAWIHGEQKEDDFSPLKDRQSAIRVFEKTDKIICVSEGAMKSVTNVYARMHELYVVNNPNDTLKIRELAAQDGVPRKRKFTFVNASRFDDKQKGYSRLLRVCRRLLNKGFDFDFWLVGGGIDYEKIVDLAKQYALDNVFFLGPQDNPYKYIKNADMYICASYSEGFSMVMMETIILATPMLSTNVPGANEMLDNGKFGMVVENSEDGIYSGMAQILSDHALYEHYREMAQQRKDYLSEDVIMEQVEGILDIKNMEYKNA